MSRNSEKFDAQAPEKEESKPIFTLADVQRDDFKVVTKQSPLQDFINGFGKVGYLYDEAVKDDARFGKFQERMENLFLTDRPTFNELAKVGDGLTKTPPASPAETGKALGDALANAITRRQAQGNVDLTSEDSVALEGAVAGMMLAARSTFDQTRLDQQTREMVDALEAQLRQRRTPYLHGVIYGDNGEPGIAVIPPGQTVDRYHF